MGRGRDFPPRGLRADKIGVMLLQENPRRPRPLHWALALSLALHGGLLFFVRQAPPPNAPPLPRLEASLGKRPSPPQALAQRPEPPPALSTKAPPKPSSRPRVLAAEKPRDPAASRQAAGREEMERFMEELAGRPKTGADLARNSLAMARDFGSRPSQVEEAGRVALERIPDSPPVDPFSLEMYVDGLVKKLNRSAAFVRNDPRSRGLHTAAIQIRIGPDGRLRTFLVLNAADQQDEIEFVRNVVERAVPFSPFPPDIGKSAQSLAMTICILPARAGEGGFGFSRGSGGGC